MGELIKVPKKPCKSCKKPKKGRLIKVKLGEIGGEYSSYYNKDVNIFDFIKQVHKDENTLKGITWVYFTLSFLFLIIYPFLGLLTTIIFHTKIYSFIYGYTEKMGFYPSYFNEFLLFCKSQPKNFIGRLNLTLISLFLSLTTWVIFFLLFNSRFIRQYDWFKLYNSLFEKGYQPKANGSWITIVKTREDDKNSPKYRCLDGNHRHIILLLIYGTEKKVTVRLK